MSDFLAAGSVASLVVGYLQGDFGPWLIPSFIFAALYLIHAAVTGGK